MTMDLAKQHVAKEVPLDPGYCKCGLALDHPEHLPPPPKPDGSFMARKRIKEFVDRHGSWVGELRNLKAKNGRMLCYTHGGVDGIPAEDLAQEMVDILWAHADRGTCRGCSTEIYWMRHAAVKAVPYDKDMQVHFATCPVRQNFKKGA